MIETLARPKSLRQQVYEQLRQALREGHLGAGERLTEMGLAAMLGVSRTPVREALGQLSREGLVEACPGGGFRVLVPNRSDLDEVFEVRGLIEPHAVARAAENATPEQLEALAAAIADERAHLDDPTPEAFASANHAFRTALFGPCGNRRLTQTIEMYDDHVQTVRLVTLNDRDVRVAVIESQTAILDAMHKGDATGAARAMARHLETAQAFLAGALETAGTQGGESS